jgi:hypothetical protein
VTSDESPVFLHTHVSDAGYETISFDLDVNVVGLTLRRINLAIVLCHGCMGQSE